MRTLLNLIWLVLAGFWLAIGYAIAGIICCILIITIPFGIAAFRIAGYALWPFGRTIVDKPTPGVALDDRQRHLVRLRRLVAGARPPRHRDRAVHDDHRHPARAWRTSS